jgi:hypothetical protein
MRHLLCMHPGSSPTPESDWNRLRAIGAFAAAAIVAAAVVGLAGIAIDRVDSGVEPTAARVQLASAHPVLYRAAAQAGTEEPPAAGARDDQFLYTREILRETPPKGYGEPKTFVNEYWRSIDGSRPGRVIELGRIWTEAPFADGWSVWPPRRQAELESLPTEPDKLRRAVVDWPGGAGVSDSVDRETEYRGLVMLLRGGMAPPALRAAAFEALAQIPDVEIIDREVDALGRAGLAIGRPHTDPSGIDWVLILDAETYEYLGTRSTRVREDGVRVQQLFALASSGIVDRVGERP